MAAASQAVSAACRACDSAASKAARAGPRWPEASSAAPKAACAWAAAAPAARAQPLVERAVAALRSRGAEVAARALGAHTLVTSTGDGPVALRLDSEERRPLS